jgi:hypothetical protein
LLRKLDVTVRLPAMVMIGCTGSPTPEKFRMYHNLVAAPESLIARLQRHRFSLKHICHTTVCYLDSASLAFICQPGRQLGLLCQPGPCSPIPLFRYIYIVKVFLDFAFFWRGSVIAWPFCLVRGGPSLRPLEKTPRGVPDLAYSPAT